MPDLVIIPSLVGPQYEVVSIEWGWHRVYVWVNEVHDKAAAEFYPVRAQLSSHTFAWRAHREGRRWVAARRLERRLVAERPNPLDLWQLADGDWVRYGRLMVEHGYAPAIREEA